MLFRSGSALAKNIHSHGYSCSVFNIDPNVTQKFLQNNAGIDGYENLQEYIESITSPRKIILMVTAGKAIDEVLSSLIPLLTSGDIIIDGGNSFYLDTERRERELEEFGLFFIGCGISGGEYGAEYGPCLMPSGSKKAYAQVEHILVDIAAKNSDGKPCCGYIGKGGSGHFVKMVHNSIEYAEMQLIADIYSVLKNMNISRKDIVELFENLNNENLDSYLLSITVDILNKSIENDNLLDKISDVARQKGTGKWVAEVSLNNNIPIPTLLEAVEVRFISEQRQLRGSLNNKYADANNVSTSEEKLQKSIPFAMMASRISINAQGFGMIKTISDINNYKIDLKMLAEIWQNGCIIRSNLLKIISDSFSKSNEFLLLDNVMQSELEKTLPGLKKIVMLAMENSIYAPVLCSSYSYLNGIKTKNMSTNLIQAQRDYFGAHTYERIDEPGVFHTDWSPAK